MTRTGDGNPRGRQLTYAECAEWVERYAATPWSMLALATATDKQPSPLQVLKSLFVLAGRVTTNQELEAWLARVESVFAPNHDAAETLSLGFGITPNERANLVVEIRATLAAASGPGEDTP